MVRHLSRPSQNASCRFGFRLRHQDHQSELAACRQAKSNRSSWAGSFATEAILHNAVIRLLDAELDVAPFFLVQPWVYGRSLDRFFASSQQVAINRLMWVLRQTAEGIHAGHQCGRVYLGLDPSHVLLGRTGRVKLIGWSQSHGLGERAWLPHDQIQSARYMAPECFVDGYRANRASDVYSMGALIYKSLSLATPYTGDSIDSIKQAVRQQTNIDLMIRQPLCPRPLYRLVRKMLSRNPHHRPEFFRGPQSMRSGLRVTLCFLHIAVQRVFCEAQWIDDGSDSTNTIVLEHRL